MKIKWRGPGIFLAEQGEQVTVVYPGGIAEVDVARGAELIAAGSASDNLHEHLQVGRDPPPTKAEREKENAMHQAMRDQHFNILLEARLHPHGEDVRLYPIPVEE